MSYLADGYCDVYVREYPRARKKHRCCACGATIRPGDHYSRTRIVFDGSARTYKRCGRCEETHAHLRDLCHGSYDNVWPDEELTCGLDYKDEWGPVPVEVAALPFLSADEASERMREAREERHD